MELLSRQWPFMKAEMIRFFETQNQIPFDRISKQHPAVVSSSSSSPFHRSQSSSRSRKKDGRGEGQEGEEERGFPRPDQAGEHEEEKISMEETKTSFIERVLGTKRSSYDRGGNILFGREGRGSPALDLECKEWERFVRKEDIQREGYVPCIVEKYGIERRLAIKRDLLESIAFDEEHGHLSYCKRHPSLSLSLSFSRQSLLWFSFSRTFSPFCPRTVLILIANPSDGIQAIRCIAVHVLSLSSSFLFGSSLFRFLSKSRALLS